MRPSASFVGVPVKCILLTTGPLCHPATQWKCSFTPTIQMNAGTLDSRRIMSHKVNEEHKINLLLIFSTNRTPVYIFLFKFLCLTNVLVVVTKIGEQIVLSDHNVNVYILRVQGCILACDETITF